MLHQADVTIIVDSHVGYLNSHVYPATGPHQELDRYVEAGLTPLQSLRAGTISGAEFPGKSERFVSVETFKSADLLILDRNPLRDIPAIQEIAGLVLPGKRFGQSNLDQLPAHLGAESGITGNAHVLMANIIPFFYPPGSGQIRRAII